MVKVEFQFHPDNVTVAIEGRTVKVSNPRYQWLEFAAWDYRPERGDPELWIAARLEKLGGKITKTHPPVPERVGYAKA
jgi:hypothetical protein